MTTPTVKIAFPDFPSGEITMKANETSLLTAQVTVDGSAVTPTNYSYEVFGTDGETPNTDTLRVTTTANPASRNITGLKIGKVKIKLTVTLTYNGSPLSASSYVLVAVVTTVTDELMSMTDAYKLFGWVNAYFSASESNKTSTFPIRETNDIYQASCTAASHLRLKVSKEIVLGDNIAFSVIRGNTFSVTLNVNDKRDQSDKTIKDNGVTNISMIGVASKLELETFTAHEDDYYSYDKSSLTGTNTGTNYVYIPRLKTLNLDYGRITCFRRDRAISLEFMGLDSYKLTPDNAHFANYSEIREDQIPPTLRTKANNRSFDRGLLPGEENLGLLNGYFRDNGAKDAPGCMAQYHKINLPPDLLADHTFDTGGANILQFMHGKGRLAYDYMDGGMKTFLKTRDSNILMYVGPIVTESVACAAFVKLEYYAFMITNQVISAWQSDTDVFLCQGNITRALSRMGVLYNQITVLNRVGKCLVKNATNFGKYLYKTETKKADVTTSVFSLENNLTYVGNSAVTLAGSCCASIQNTAHLISTGIAHRAAAAWNTMGQNLHLF